MKGDEGRDSGVAYEMVDDPPSPLFHLAVTDGPRANLDRPVAGDMRSQQG